MSHNNFKLLFFTYADSKYDMFAVPYAYFALLNNPNSLVEICLENENLFYAKYKDAIELLELIFPKRTLFRQSTYIKNNKNVIPNTLRFVEVPKLKAKYLYIGDIDLLVFEDVCETHLDLMKTYDLPFSNILRVSSNDTKNPRLSGLHFIDYDLYYPLPDISDLNLTIENDEYVLYECMKRKNLMVPLSFQIRPECGIHMSLSRDPLGRTSGPTQNPFKVDETHAWGGRRYYQRFLKQLKDESFCKLHPYLDISFRLLLIALESAATLQSRAIHRLANSYLVDKRMIFSSNDNFSISDFYKKRDEFLKSKDFSSALELGCLATILWPSNIDIWFKQAWLYMATGKTNHSIEALLHIYELPKGKDLIVKSNIISTNLSIFRNYDNAKPLLTLLNLHE